MSGKGSDEAFPILFGPSPREFAKRGEKAKGQGITDIVSGEQFRCGVGADSFFLRERERPRKDGPGMAGGWPTRSKKSLQHARNGSGGEKEGADFRV